jgi:hypothetical protein
MAVLMDAGAAVARGAATDIEVTKEAAPISAAEEATTIVDVNLYIAHNNAGPRAYHTVVPVTE